MSYYLLYTKLLVLMSGDIETNHGPISSIIQSSSICHWNLNSISSDNFIKVLLLQAYLTTHSFDIACLSETYLEATILNDDARLSQPIEEFNNFKSDFEQTIINIDNNNPFINMDEISCHHGLQQIINSPTHILPNTASCIDLIFTSQPNLIIDCWNHASLFPRCHHQIIFTKINFQVHIPLPYERLIWDYPKANKI